MLLRAKNSIRQGSPWRQEGPDLPSTSAAIVQASGGHASPTYYVGDHNQLWKSSPNSGGSRKWKRIVPGDQASKAYRFFVNPYDANDVYIVDDNAVRHSTDGGITWPKDHNLDSLLTENGSFLRKYRESDPFHNFILNEMIFYRENSDIRFAAGLAGVFYSTDKSNWSRLIDTKALPSRPVGLYFDPVSDPNVWSLYMAFAGRGVMRCPIPKPFPMFKPIPMSVPGTSSISAPIPVPVKDTRTLGEPTGKGRNDADDRLWSMIAIWLSKVDH